MARTIATERLTLRPLKMSDAAIIAGLIGDYDVARWLTVVPHPYTLQDAEDFIENFPNDWRFGIALGNRIIGVISVDMQLGYWLGAAYWGRGFMSEACNAFVSAWFVEDGADLTSGYFIDNARSGAVLSKLGFTPTQVIMTDSVAQGRKVELQEMTLSRADWQARHG